MRHLNYGRKLNRTSSHRKALFRNLVVSLVRSERIITTRAKAKDLRRFADRMVTLGKHGDLAARRLAFDFMRSREAVKKVFDELTARFKDRNGGYTRVIPYGFRRGDAAELAVIEWVGSPEEAKGKKPKKRRAKKEAPAREERRAAG
jgi:large subunit ribosomal protein L17